MELLTIENLVVSFADSAVVNGVSFGVAEGGTVALVGESGSGKSVTAMSVLDLLPAHAHREGRISFGGEDLLRASETRMRSIRGKDIAMIFQEPMTAMNPVYTIGAQMVEAIRSHSDLSHGEAKIRAIELLEKVRMPDPERRIGLYPHQLSGGQRQRAMIAAAISGKPKLLIADEPTTALDVTVQAEILDLIRDLQQELGMSVLMITHDMGVVAEMADFVVVMKDGKVIENANCHTLFASPTETYTRELLAAVPRLGTSEIVSGQPSAALSLGDKGAGAVEDAVLTVSDLAVTYPARGLGGSFRAVDGVSFEIGRGEVLGVVGESGSGKSTIGRSIVGLASPSQGVLRLGDIDLSAPTRAERRLIRSQVSMVFQDPSSSLDPRSTIGDSVVAPLRWNSLIRGKRALRSRAEELLDAVRIPGSWSERYPHELSGGQRQRVGIARAISTNPALLIADEPTSALDVSVQATVLKLLQELQRSMGFSCLFISHDLSVVELLSERVMVLRGGKIVELAPTRQILHHPVQEYTRRLIAAAPIPDPVVQSERRAVRRESRR